MWLVGPPNLEKMKAQRDVKGLTKALGYQKESWVRKEAAEALTDIGWRPGQDASGAAYWAVRRKWDKCIEIGAPAVAPLIVALKDSYGYMREGAAQALGQIGDARAVESLSAALKDRDWDVGNAAAAALVKIGDARAVEPLIAALTDSDSEIRRATASALGQIGDARAIKPLIAAAWKWGGDTGKAAKEALVQIGDGRRVPTLPTLTCTGCSKR